MAAPAAPLSVPMMALTVEQPRALASPDAPAILPTEQLELVMRDVVSKLPTVTPAARSARSSSDRSSRGYSVSVPASQSIERYGGICLIRSITTTVTPK